MTDGAGTDLTAEGRLDGLPLDGERGGGAIAHAWSALLDAQIRLEEAAAGVRRNLVLTAVVVALASFLLKRFLLLTQAESLIVDLSPLALVLAGAAIDLGYYQRKLDRISGLILDLEDDHPDGQRLQRTRQATAERDDAVRMAVVYYLLPGLVFAAFAVWQLA